jgi:hypothetical protein
VLEVMEALGDLWIFGIKYYSRSEGTMAVEQTVLEMPDYFMTRLEVDAGDSLRTLAHNCLTEKG